MRTSYAIFSLLFCMAATSGCVDEAPNNCVPGDNFDCLDDVDAGNGDDDDTGTTTPEEVCDDTLDNDGDGDVDCDDSDCDDAANCTEQPDDEVCDDNVDNDGDGLTDCDDSDCDDDPNCVETQPVDNDGDGWYEDDCDDTVGSGFYINPGAQEVCDGVDNDCDGVVDNDNAVDASVFYADNDADGYGNESSGTTYSCSVPDGYSVTNNDCDDIVAEVNPGATEICDNLTDDDCDGYVSCADVDDCNGQPGAELSFTIGTADTDDTPLATAYWQDVDSSSVEAIGLSASSLAGLSFELTCGLDTCVQVSVLTDSISIEGSPNFSICADGSDSLDFDTTTACWSHGETSYAATPTDGVWFNMEICVPH